MRLLELTSHSSEPSLTADLTHDIPVYAILSHTWGPDTEEVSFDDIKDASCRSKAGYAKIRFCGQQAWRDGLRYFWVDTCCIDKRDFTELHTAINSMFRWYNGAVKCYVYLSDVSVCDDDHETQETWKSAFRKSQWFKRGWTLQELIAPRSVEFFSSEGKLLGNKNTLEQLIHEITEIPISVLRGAPVSKFTVDERLRWSAKRNTKREEDQAYCLLGIFDVFMPLIYGEGHNAFIRLKKEIDQSSRKAGTSTLPSGENGAAGQNFERVTPLRISKDRNKCILTLTGHESLVFSVAFSPEGWQLASAAEDGTVRLWDTATGKSIRTHTYHRDFIRSVAFSPNGEQLVSASENGKVWLWDIVTGKTIRTFMESAAEDRKVPLLELSNLALPIHIYSGYKGPVRSVAFSPNGKLVALVSNDTIGWLWNTDTMGAQFIPEKAMAIAFSSDGRGLLLASVDGTVQLWDTAGGLPLRRTNMGFKDPVRSVAFSPNEKHLVSVSNNRTVHLWDIATGESLGTLMRTESAISSVAFSPDGRQLALALEDTTLQLWDIGTATEF